jgi:predicted PurR-regulated permease PerM
MGGVAALICAVSFALLMLAAALVVLKLARTMTITNNILDDMRKEAVPLMGKLETTMDHINSEMGYVDGILKSAEKLADRANSMTKAAQQVVTSPLVKILTLGVGAQRALGLTPSRKERVEAEAEGD